MKEILFLVLALNLCVGVNAQLRRSSAEIKLEDTFVVDEFGNDSVKPAPAFDVFADFVKLKSSISLKYPKGYDLVESRLSAWSTDMRTLRKRLSAAKYRYLLASPDKGHLILYPALDLPTRALPLGYKDGRYLVTDINGALDVEGKPLIRANVNPFTEEGVARHIFIETIHNLFGGVPIHSIPLFDQVLLDDVLDQNRGIITAAGNGFGMVI